MYTYIHIFVCIRIKYLWKEISEIDKIGSFWGKELDSWQTRFEEKLFTRYNFVLFKFWAYPFQYLKIFHPLEVSPSGMAKILSLLISLIDEINKFLMHNGGEQNALCFQTISSLVYLNRKTLVHKTLTNTLRLWWKWWVCKFFRILLAVTSPWGRASS